MSETRRPPWKRVLILVVGWTANQWFVWGFDWVLYPAVIYSLGLLWGGVTMALLSFAICYLTLLFYDWSKTDWLGIEMIKAARETEESQSRSARAIAWALKKSDPVAMVVISVILDPFMTVVYMRKGAFEYDGMGKREWKIFIWSWMIGNVYWSLASYLGVSVIEWIWNFAKGLVG